MIEVIYCYDKVRVEMSFDEYKKIQDELIPLLQSIYKGDKDE